MVVGTVPRGRGWVEVGGGGGGGEFNCVNGVGLGVQNTQKMMSHN